MINILFCGIGGQGVLKAAEIAGWAAVLEGYHVKKSEVHGMAQRGGSVESHLRFGEEVFSPLISKGEADFLVSFHLDEHARMTKFLRASGIDLIKYLDRAEAEIKDKHFINTYLLGVLSKKLPLKESSWLKALELELAGKKLVENKQVFLKGRSEAE